MRIGDQVSLQMNGDATAVCNKTAPILMAIPTRFRPSVIIRQWCFVNLLGTPQQARVDISSAGIQVWADITGASFSGSGTSGIYSSFFTWLL